MKFNYSLDDMRCFCTVAQYGSFKQASLVLDIPLSTLSRRVAKLEQDLGMRLLNRDAHRVQLTHLGQRYYERSAPLFEELQDLALCALQDKTQAKGVIRISAPVNYGAYVLAEHFNAFLKAYPDIQLDLRLSNQNIDIEEEAIDIAFRVGDHSADHWIGRTLSNIRFVICSQADMDVSDIKTPSELDHFPVITCAPMNIWKLQHIQTGEMQAYKPCSNVRLKVDDIIVLTRAIKDGIGIGLIPEYHAQPFIESGDIKQILPQWSNQPRGCQMLYRDRDNMPFRLRLLIDFMSKRFDEI
jgi:LysR family transcriptional regulator AphB